MCRFVRSAPFALTAIVVFPAQPATGQMQQYESRYYRIHTDLTDAQAIREIDLRLTHMAEAYHELTRHFAGKISKRLPFYLFRRQEDYIAAGGIPNSAGVFAGDRLMAVAGDQVSDRTWKVIQHEGFHQFVRHVIRGDIPVWVNEGLAEYFEEAVFTGDRFITGLIPQHRLARVQARIESNSFRSIPSLILIEHERWNAEMATANYDQAWSMVHFLAHGDDGKYEAPFNAFLLDVGRHRLRWKKAWVKHFGPLDGSFEAAWKRYWTELPDNPTQAVYAEATLDTLTNFLARAVAAGQTFKSIEEFFDAAETGRLKSHAKDWLPPGLLATALRRAQAIGTWTIEPTPHRPPKLICKLEDGTTLIGTFKMGRRRAGQTTVEIHPPPR